MVWVGYLAIPITLIWLVVSLALWRVYPVLLLQASSQPVRFGEQLDVAEMLDPGTLRGLSRPLRDPDPQRCSAAIDVVAEAPADLAAAAFASAARAAGDETRALLVAALDRVLERTPTRTPANHRAARDVAELLGESLQRLPRCSGRRTLRKQRPHPASQAVAALRRHIVQQLDDRNIYKGPPQIWVRQC